MSGDNTPAEVSALPEGSSGPDRTRQLIVAANELLDEGGLEALTVRAVLKRTGLARRAFYERFAGKDDLMLAVFEEMFEEAADFFRGQAAQFSEPIERLETTVVGLVSGAFEQEGITHYRAAAMVQEHLRLAQTRPEELEVALRPLGDFIAEEVTEGIRRGQLRECDPDLQATLIYNLVATTLHTVLMMQERGQSMEQWQSRLPGEIWEFCRRAIIA